MLPDSPVTSRAVLPLSISTRRSLWSEPLQSSDFESGAQVMALLSQSTSLSFFGLLPNSSEIQISWRPVRSEMKAIHLPLGDQRASCSRHGVSVTRCGSDRKSVE